MEAGKKAWWCCWMAMAGLMLMLVGCLCDQVEEYIVGGPALITVRAKEGERASKEVSELKEGLDGTLRSLLHWSNAGETIQSIQLDQAASETIQLDQATSGPLQFEILETNEGELLLWKQQHVFHNSYQHNMDGGFVLVLASAQFILPSESKSVKARRLPAGHAYGLIAKEVYDHGMRFSDTITQPCELMGTAKEVYEHGMPLWHKITKLMGTGWSRKREIFKELDVLGVTYTSSDAMSDAFGNNFLLPNEEKPKVKVLLSAYITRDHPIALPNFSLAPKLEDMLLVQSDGEVFVARELIQDLLENAMLEAIEQVRDNMFEKQEKGPDTRTLEWKGESTKSKSWRVTTTIEYKEEAQMGDVYDRFDYTFILQLLRTRMFHIYVDEVKLHPKGGYVPRTICITYPKNVEYPTFTIKVEIEMIPKS